MASISFKHIRKVYDNSVEIVKDFSLEIEDKEFIILVGPSGCGKSTTLRMIAGLEEITSGELSIGDRVVNNVPPKDRDIAMVFQSYALYPHMTVYKNMSFGLELKKVDKEEIKRRVEEAATVLDIKHLLDRKPKALSGGQRQRVALGRAMVRQPAVFLLDEPLSNLDAKLRVQMRTELIKLHKKLGTTFVYVTHDQVEAMTMGDRIVVMKDGDIMQVDDAATLYNKPNNLFVAGFIGSPQMNFIPATLKKEASGFSIKFLNYSINLPSEKCVNLTAADDGKEVTLGIRPEHINISSDADAVSATVDVTEMVGAETYVYLTLGEKKMTIKVSSTNAPKMGETIKVKLDAANIHAFDKTTEKNLIKH